MTEIDRATLHLTPDQIRAAVKDGSNHPLTVALAKNSEIVNAIIQEHSSVRGGLRILADVFEQLDFSLDLEQLVAVWSLVVAKFSDTYQRHKLTEIIFSSYSIKGVPGPERWRGFPGFFLENQVLPPQVVNDKDGLLHVRSKLEELARYKNKIDDCLRDPNVDGSSPILEDIIDSVGNGITPIIGHVYYALRKLNIRRTDHLGSCGLISHVSQK